MSSNPFENFDSKPVSNNISNKVIETSINTINPKILNLSIKYGAIFTVSIFFSLLVCPQRGTGIFRGDFPLFHHLLHQSEILCGLYCGLVFFITTHLLTFFLLGHFERLKIVKELTLIPVIFISVFFGISMTSFFSKADFSTSYNISWILIVGVSYLLLNRFYSKSI